MTAVYTGKNIIQFAHVDSTNSVASELLSNTKPLADGTVIMADEQSKGRGQLGSSWESEAGKNFNLSIIYYPHFLAIENQFQLSMVISLGLFDFISAHVKGVSIKWPNDLFVNNKKIAGVLIENSIQNTTIKSSIIGIGINVNQLNFSAIATNPTSLAIENNCTFDLNELKTSLFESIERWYEQLKAKKSVYIKQQYHLRLFKMMELATFECSEGIVEGKIKGISDSGELMVEIGHLLKSFSNKEIKLIL